MPKTSVSMSAWGGGAGSGRRRSALGEPSEQTTARSVSLAPVAPVAIQHLLAQVVDVELGVLQRVARLERDRAARLGLHEAGEEQADMAVSLRQRLLPESALQVEADAEEELEEVAAREGLARVLGGLGKGRGVEERRLRAAAGIEQRAAGRSESSAHLE